ncbi:hypothetical protein PV327_008684 [Microctonus hyperodae]|uniref:Transmembrane protein 42 n=1 Tax=Microctonus hyperodae TaxID=165561 RepID=A0AA39KHS5_MICHY|nr:hypothetical protein PV327_008684 [Microctonus hyperodae]
MQSDNKVNNTEDIMEIKPIFLAVISGCLGTAGSVFGKFAGGLSTLSWIELMFKLIIYIIMITCNTISHVLFVNSLVSSKSSTPSTVVSSAVNYFSSALAGFIFFNESTSLLWWCGTSMVLLGLIVICKSSSNEYSSSDKEKKNE